MEITRRSPNLVDDNILRMLRDGPLLMRRSSMWFLQESSVISKCLILLFMEMGMLLQASVASMMLKGLSEKTTVDREQIYM